MAHESVSVVPLCLYFLLSVSGFQVFESDGGGQSCALPPRSTEVSHRFQ